MSNYVYAYIRVSTNDQKTDRQRQALNEYFEENNLNICAVFEDKASGKDFERRQYQALKQIVNSGDTIIIKELDRLGRNYEEIKRELSYFQGANVKVRILDLPVLDVNDDTLSTLLNNLMIELLSYIAQKEREKIQSRVKEGLNNAKSKGIKLGRPERKLPKDFEKYYKKWEASEITAVEFSKLMGISRATLYRYIDTFNAKG